MSETDVGIGQQIREPLSSKSAGRPHAFVTLDGLRGFAAVSLLPYHLRRLFTVSPFVDGFLFQRAYLAVDFFFMLSGFVLTYAYQRKIDASWSAGSFFKTRLIRFYPLYLAGLLLGVVFEVLRTHVRALHHFTYGEILIFSAFGLFFLPTLPAFRSTLSFPLNSPSWSLLDELVVNLFHVLVLRRRSLAGLCVLTAAACLLWSAALVRWHRLNYGFLSWDWAWSFGRVLFPYLLGCLLFRVWSAGRFRLRVPPVFLAALLVGVFSLPIGWGDQAWTDALITLLVFPFVILAGAVAQPAGALALCFRAMGLASYAIYAIHVPASLLFEQVLKRVAGVAAEELAPWSGIVCTVFVVGTALLADKFYDGPIRASLRRKIFPK